MYGKQSIFVLRLFHWNSPGTILSFHLFDLFLRIDRKVYYTYGTDGIIWNRVSIKMKNIKCNKIAIQAW